MSDSTQRRAERPPGRALFENGDYQIVREAMEALSPRERTVIHLRFWEGRSTEEIARTLRLPWETAWTTLQGALAGLRGACLAAPGFSRSRRARDAA